MSQTVYFIKNLFIEYSLFCMYVDDDDDDDFGWKFAFWHAAMVSKNVDFHQGRKKKIERERKREIISSKWMICKHLNLG